jgi:1,4-alpha-glucan branching enzyme
MAVTFVFRAPGASRVSLVGDFNGWDPEAMPLRRAALGDTWIAQVRLEHGLHAYAFVIDDTDWSADPSAPLAAEASFGRRNSVVVVGEGDAL